MSVFTGTTVISDSSERYWFCYWSVTKGINKLLLGSIDPFIYTVILEGAKAEYILINVILKETLVIQRVGDNRQAGIFSENQNIASHQ